MSTRPTRRKSTLSGTHPVEPGPESQGQDEAPTSKKAPHKTRGKTKFSFYVPDELLGRARAAAPHGQVEHRVTGMSAWLSKVLEQEVQRLEEKYNGGRQYEPADAGEVTRPGPPVKNPF